MAWIASCGDAVEFGDIRFAQLITQITGVVDTPSYLARITEHQLDELKAKARIRLGYTGMWAAVYSMVRMLPVACCASSANIVALDLIAGLREDILIQTIKALNAAVEALKIVSTVFANIEKYWKSVTVRSNFSPIHTTIFIITKNGWWCVCN
jgi:hypothetical protein